MHYFRINLYVRLTILYLFLIKTASAQTLGGNSAFNFLRLSNTPQLSALGGANISQPSNDVGLAYNNPALLKPAMHTQLNAVFNDFYAGIKVYHLSLGYHHKKLNTNFAWGIHYFDYGKVSATDASGNLLGKFKPTDWTAQLSASRCYLEKWNYGATLKFISSNYGQYRSNGIAVDAGVNYYDSAKLFSASVLVKNAGFQLKKYPGTEADELPFDLQAGITLRLKNAPFSFSLTSQKTHRYNLRYNDTLFNTNNGFTSTGNKKLTFAKLADHLVLATTVFLGNNLEAQFGYNFLRRHELNIGNAGNGLNGFSLGAGVKLGKLWLRYARAYYQANTAFNQVGLNMQLNAYFGLGSFGKKTGW
jgi:hypothetical protein